jgi:prephenate dehydratase
MYKNHRCPTGVKCGTGQSNTNSSVFYLAFNNEGRSERTCEVPAGKGLLIPIMLVEYSEIELPGATVDELRVVTDSSNNISSMSSFTQNRLFGEQAFHLNFSNKNNSNNTNNALYDNTVTQLQDDGNDTDISK